MKKINCLVGMAVLMAVALPSSGDIFLDNFDSEAADVGNPDNYSLFGTQLADRGVETSPVVSSPNAAYITVDYGAAGFGVVMNHDAIAATSFLNAMLSIQVRADTDESGNAGTFGFRLQDADGTEARTLNANLFSPSTTYQAFSQSVTALTQIDAAGADSILDFSNIVRYDLVFLDQGDVNDVVNYNVDDFRGIEAVPEASTLQFMVLGLLGIFTRRRYLNTAKA